MKVFLTNARPDLLRPEDNICNDNGVFTVLDTDFIDLTVTMANMATEEMVIINFFGRNLCTDDIKECYESLIIYSDECTDPYYIANFLNDLFGRVPDELLRFTINDIQCYVKDPIAMVDGDSVILKSPKEFQTVIYRMKYHSYTYNTTLPVTEGVTFSNHDLIAIEIMDIEQSGDLYQFYNNWQS